MTLNLATLAFVQPADPSRAPKVTSSVRKLYRFAIFTALVSLAIPTAANAQTTIGQLAPANPPDYCLGIPVEIFPIGASAASYTVPSAGAITSWSTNAGGREGQMLTFKVYRPIGGEEFRVVGHDGPRSLNPSVLNTFKTSISVQAGDVIGFNDVTGGAQSACAFMTGSIDDRVTEVGLNAADQTTFHAGGAFGELRINVSATFLPAPAVTTVSPPSGSVKGGSAVTIGGSNFAEVKSVSFAGIPAKGFTVNSESQITAITPANSQLIGVPVSVTTIAGSATAPQSFTYEGCRVPKLKNLALKRAKKKLQRANCKLGRVKTIRPAHHPAGANVPLPVVKKQSSKPGELLAPGANVNLTVFLSKVGLTG